MTSSLVGSEMCIRDRCHGPGAAPGVTMGPVASARSSLKPFHGPRHCHCTVSYTHLTLPTICSV
eukprot:2660817-Prorocentrum_lima.AAC.1